MYKACCVLFLSAFLFIGMTGCTSKQKNDLRQYDDMPLAEYLEQTELPKNLEADLDPESVKDFTEAYSYDTVEFLNLDLDAVSKELLKNPETGREVWALGTQVIAETEQTEEYLSVYDGGVAFGTEETTTQGGFEYHFFPDKNTSPLYGIFSPDYPDYCFSDTSVDWWLMDGYFGLDKDLDFSTREAAKNNIYAFLKAVGVENVELNYITSYDYKTIKSFRNRVTAFWEKKKQQSPESELSVVYPEPQKADEFYQLIGRQRINGIPVNSYRVSSIIDQPDANSAFWCTYGKEGIVNASVSYLLKQPEEAQGTKEQLLTASSAFNLIQTYYGKGSLLEKHSVESLELVYTMLLSEDRQTASLKPCWFARVSYPMTFQYNDSDGQKQTAEFKGYDHLYFDAVTGEYQNFSPSAKNP